MDTNPRSKREKVHQELVYDIIGKVPPNNIEYEKYVLGVTMLYPNKLETFVNLLIPECFYEESHKIIAAIIFALAEQNKPVNVITVTENLRKTEKLELAGGSYYIVILTSNVGFDYKLEPYILDIIDCYVKREIIRITQEIQGKAFHNEYDAKTLIDEAIEELYRTNEIFGRQETITIESIRESVEKELVEMRTNNEKYKVKSNIQLFDKNVDIKPNKLIFISALEKAGKTKNIIRLIIEFLRHNKENLAVKMWLMETTDNDLYVDAAASLTGFNTDYIISKSKKLSKNDLGVIKEEMDFFKKCDIEFEFKTSNITNIAMNCKQFVKKRQDKLNIFVIDNYNICRDAEDGSFNDKELKVSGKLQQMKNHLNQDNYKSVIIVIDHISPNNLLENAKKKGITLLETGFRVDIDDAGGTVRKRQIVDQFIAINRPGMHPELVKAYGKKKIILNNQASTVKTYLEKVTIIEILRNRRGSSKREDCVIHLLFDLGNMQYEKVDVKDAEIANEPYRERNITKVDNELFDKEIWKKDWARGSYEDTIDILNECLNPKEERTNEWGAPLTLDYIIYKYDQYCTWWDASKGQWDIKYTVATKHAKMTLYKFLADIEYKEKYILHKSSEEKKVFDYLGIPY